MATAGISSDGVRRGTACEVTLARLARTIGVACALVLASLALSNGGPMSPTCPGGNQPFFPTDVAFGASGDLYVTDARNGSVFHLDGERCVAIAEGWARPFGVAVDGERLCVSHFTSDDPLTRESAVSCRDESGWTVVARGLGSGINGLASTPTGVWLAAWEDTPVESRNGVLFRLTGEGVAQEVRLDDGVPRFLAPTPAGGLLITVQFEDASGITAGAVLEWSPDGRLVRHDHAVDRPAGIAWSDLGIWIADAGRGELTLVAPNGRRLVHPHRLQEPSGLALSSDGGICVAEAGRSRITCVRPEEMLEKEAHHEE